MTTITKIRRIVRICKTTGLRELVGYAQGFAETIAMVAADQREHPASAYRWDVSMTGALS